MVDLHVSSMLLLRFMLWRSKVIPWKFARFLNYAVERIFLRRVGGGYIFIHRLLLEHFTAIGQIIRDTKNGLFLPGGRRLNGFYYSHNNRGTCQKT